MGQQKVFTLSRVAQHKSKKDCWLIINGRVLEVTKFLEEHPGGDDVLMESAGRDATKEFKDVGHSKAAHDLLRKYQVGILQGYTSKEEESTDASFEESKGREMSAFVIKDDSTNKYATFLHFFVPLVVGGSYFCYSYLSACAIN